MTIFNFQGRMVLLFLKVFYIDGFVWYNLAMKILPIIPYILFLARNVLWADTYAKGIDYMRDHNDPKSEKALINEVTDAWARRILKKWDWTINVTGQEKLPEDGPVVFISNHQGFADVLPFMCCVPFQCGYIAKQEIKKVPHFARWIRRVRGIYINRGDARESLKSINEGVDYLKQGFSLVIFPEGTRAKGPDYELGEFHHGSFKLATKAKVPIVPVTINGTYKLFEEPGVVQKHQSFDVTFHDLIDVASMDRSEYAALPEKVREIIKSAL